MGVVNVKKELDGRLELEPGLMTDTRQFSVLFDTDDEYAARRVIAASAEGVPRMYSSHPGSRWLYVQRKGVREKGPFLFIVTCYYAGITGTAADAGEGPIDPLLIPPQWSWSFSMSNERIDREIEEVTGEYGNAITNSAGQSFDPPLTQDIPQLVGRCVRNLPAYDALFAADYIGTWNSDVWGVFDPGVALCTQLSGDQVQTPFMTYWKVTYEFVFRWNGWNRRVLDEGFAEKTGVDGEGKPIYKMIKDGNSVVMSEPVRLDGLGEIKTWAAADVFLEFNTRRKMPFAALGLI